MAVSPGTTNIAVKREIAERLRSVAEEAGLTSLEVANQVLTKALDHGKLKLEKVEIIVDLDNLPGNGTGTKRPQ